MPSNIKCVACSSKSLIASEFCCGCLVEDGKKQILARVKSQPLSIAGAQQWYIPAAVSNPLRESVFAPATIDVIACRVCLSQFPMLEGEEIFPACPRYGSCPAAKEYWSKQPRGEAEAHETARLYINEDKLRAGAIPKEIFVWLAEKYISARLAACAGGTLELKTKEPEPPTRVVVWDGFADRPDAGESNPPRAL